MIIQCTGEQAFGGRTGDTFFVDGVDSLDDLQEYIKNKMPLKCKQPTRYYRWTIIAKESLEDRLVYLNNYLKIKEVFGYTIMTESERADIENTNCSTCFHKDDSLSSIFRCKYDPDNFGNCETYSEEFNFKKWLKSKFQ